MLEIKKIKKEYANSIVVDIEYLGISAGETVGIIGNNGAGKTTLFRMLLDLIRPTSGMILSKGYDVANNNQWKNYTASYLDDGFLINYLTPEEYFMFIGELNQLSRNQMTDYLKIYEDFFNGEILNSGKYIRDFSTGNKNKIGITSALMQKPDLLILDEPFANLDPTTQIRLKEHLKSLKTKRMTTLISSHDLNHVTEICERIILFEKGKIIKDIYTDQNTLKELEDYFAQQ
ncbi:ABC-2 type transport system ATP-binding protein [Pedobacter cryoconitis]|uniref:ABC transporter ATP-binding protein n=1 Tax=Pedobacter cryoconitis TaxID=188932 RepID=UPI00161128E9|nr:ABC transporter ATP-binding protein [Pedobacter cryoconitis]MBB6273151.1 ABC-2 type transport system ATP-binding protein [Pedobacter cryoconitis]